MQFPHKTRKPTSQPALTLQIVDYWHKFFPINNLQSPMFRSPNGNRTRISALRGLRPKPLDDRAGTMKNAKLKMKKVMSPHFSFCVFNFSLYRCPARARTWTLLIQSQTCCQLHQGAVGTTCLAPGIFLPPDNSQASRGFWRRQP